MPGGASHLATPALAAEPNPSAHAPHFGRWLHLYEALAGFGPRSDEIARRGAALRASLSHPNSRKERIDDEHHISPVRCQF